MRFLLIYIVLLSSILFSCKALLQEEEDLLPSKNKNTCKNLQQDVVLFAVFVDSKKTGFWTDYEIAACLDSITKAVDWIGVQAEKSNIPLNIKVEYHKNNNGIIPIKNNFSLGSFSKTLFPPGDVSEYERIQRGISFVDKWADKLAKEVSKTFDISADSSFNLSKARKLEDLVLRLRMHYQTENIALMFFINEYYTKEISASFHCNTDDIPEYAVVSDKLPAVIIHEFLHLFGAIDYANHAFESDAKNMLKRRDLFSSYKRDVMYNPYQNLNRLYLKPLTKYCIGWKPHLSKKEKDLLRKNKRINPKILTL